MLIRASTSHYPCPRSLDADSDGFQRSIYFIHSIDCVIEVILAGVLISVVTRLHVVLRRSRQPAAEEYGRLRSLGTKSAAACEPLALLLSLPPRLGLPAETHPKCFTERLLQARWCVGPGIAQPKPYRTMSSLD
jgi:hypothetical protein